MMDPIESLFIGEDYNIVTDKVQRIIPEDPRVLEEIYITYCQIRRVQRAFRPSKLGDELNRLHQALARRIRALEPNQPRQDDGKGHSQSGPA